jgi:MoxR-like ATPase
MTQLPRFDVYVGDGSPHGDRLLAAAEQPALFREHGKYLASEELADAVNIAIAVGQPLLVTGEPGCGKTRLAWSIADELGLGEPLVFQTRSTSRAQDLLYRYDAVLRFHDIQVKTQILDGRFQADDPSHYIEYQALGQAIRGQTRRVVLIDEIDKAPRDFPNDLLHELERMSFSVPELERGEPFSAAVRPIVVITSNSERQLPLPFLRRCVFHHIQFPDHARLCEIIQQRLGPIGIESGLIGGAVDRFVAIRAIPRLNKPPATSELLAWVQALAMRGMSAKELAARTLRDLPLWQTLIKSQEDRQLLLDAR